MPKYQFEEIAINSTEKKKPTEEDKYTYLGLEHLDTGTLKVSRIGADVAPIGEKLVMRKGDVLFGKRRAYQKKVAIAPFDGIFSAHGMVLRPREEVVDKRFFPLFISSDYFLDAAIAISVGSLSPTINWRDLKTLEFELPPLEEQRKLADVLWAINDTMEAYKKLLSSTEQLVKSQFIEMFGDPIDNTKNLPTESLSEHLTLVGGFAFKSTGFAKTGVPVLRIGNINAGYFKPDDLPFWEEDPSLERYALYPGDLVISLTGTVGKDDFGNVCRLGDDYPKYYLNQRNAKLELKDTVLPEFITALLKNRRIKDKITNAGQGVRQANISNKNILELVVPVPKIEDQMRYAELVQQSDKSKFDVEIVSNLNLSRWLEAFQ